MAKRREAAPGPRENRPRKMKEGEVQGDTPEGVPAEALRTKSEDLETSRQRPEESYLTTDHGLRVEHTDDSLKAGPRGPTIMEDFHFREKLTRFDHERIPERVVHARGSGAHGHFRVYESLERLTKARFLCDPSLTTPVFVRFSTVVGSRGSADTVRDVRGFATKFYTPEGNFDLVGNNIPVFFIQDGIKFPDLVHAVKPEPMDEMPQASSAHDTFWDFVSLTPETAHMVMWLMSDRAIPRSYRMMEGFGVHTFRLVNAQGKARLCKFHWKPVLGLHSLVWDEAQTIAGRDPDFHRRDLWNAISGGEPAEYELGLQVVEEKDELAFGFDLLDPTKLLPEEVVPVERVGRLTLDKNPDNFFAETEQVAFHVGNVVPGIDFTNDPLLQARLFSYLDTQLIRLGGPNFAQLPINRPIVPVRNHQQDGYGQHFVPTAPAMYHPNSVARGEPRLATTAQGAYAHFAERVDGAKIRERSESFRDHFGQATLFLNSLAPFERRHLLKAFRFEVGKVERPEIRQRIVDLFANVDVDLAREIAAGVGATPPKGGGKGKRTGGGRGGRTVDASPALSLAKTPKDSIRTRLVAVLVADGVRAGDVAALEAQMMREGALIEVIAHALGTVSTEEGPPLEVHKSRLTTASVLYDAVFVPGGAESAKALAGEDDVRRFLGDQYRHCKTIGARGEAVEVLMAALAPLGVDVGEGGSGDPGIVTGDAGDPEAFARAFADALRQGRHYGREKEPAGQ
jgi:catalase